MKDFRTLLVWQKSHRLVLNIYKATAGLPAEEKFGLQSQIRRATISVPTNIAEGCGRSTDSDFRRFLDIAMGSANEVEYLVYLAAELGFVEAKASRQLAADVSEIKRMLSSLIVKLRADR